MSQKITFSICIPTYNSAKTLRYTLKSISQQAYSRNDFEVMIIDGGSTDETMKIVKDFKTLNIKVYDNARRLPEYAKSIGIQKAIGKYIIFMDSDESFASKTALVSRRNAFVRHPEVNVLLADKLHYVKGYGVAGHYLNKCGDPFTYFMYRQRDGVLETFSKNITKSEGKWNLLFFKENDKMPIADGGTTTVDLDYARENWSEELSNIDFACSIVNKVLSETRECLCIKDDDVLHRSRSTLKTYLSKIKFRIINNVFAPNESGFSNRKISQSKKKYLFPLYTVSIILPIFDGIALSARHGKPSMMLHPLYCWYTTIQIAKYMTLKLFKRKKINEEY